MARPKRIVPHFGEGRKEPQIVVRSGIVTRGEEERERRRIAGGREG